MTALTTILGLVTMAMGVGTVSYTHLKLCHLKKEGKGKKAKMNILNIEHVSKIFGDKKIFDDVSYGVQEGDKIGIVGLNGTGKTTMLNIIAGVEEVDEGQIIMPVSYTHLFFKERDYEYFKRNESDLKWKGWRKTSNGSGVCESKTK